MDDSRATGGPRRVNKKPAKRRDLKPSTVPTVYVAAPKPPPASFTRPIGRVDKPITQAQHRAHRQAAAARRATEARVTIPYVPKLAHPTHAQRAAAADAGRRVFQRGIRTQADIDALPPAQRHRLNRILGYSATQNRNVQANVGRLATPNANSYTVRQLAELGRRLASTQRSEIQPGRPHSVLQAGFLPNIDLTQIARTLGDITTLDTGDLGPREFFNNTVGDVKALGTAPFLGAYQIGRGGYEAIRHGNTKRLEKLGAGVYEGLKQSVEHPGEYIRRHPLFAALDVLGASSIAGRAAGGIARATGHPIGSRVRPPVAFIDDPGVVRGLYRERTYSPDLIRASIQRANDSRRARVLGPNDKPVAVVDRGKRVPVMAPGLFQGDRFARRRGNFLSSRHTMTERLARDREAAERTIKLRGKGRNWGRGEQKAQTLAVMVTEGQLLTGKTLRRDLGNRLDRLRREYRERTANNNQGWNHTGEKKQAGENIRFLEDVMANPRLLARAEEIAAEGIRHGTALTQADKRLAELDMLPERAGTAARLKHVAIEHLDARWDPEKEHLVAGPRTPGFAEGEVIPYTAVEDFLRSQGRDPATVGFLPAVMPGRRAWHAQLRPSTRPNLLKQTRTGELYRKGATKTTPDLLKQQGVRQQVLLNKAEQIDSMVGEHTLTHPALAKARRGEALTPYEQKVVREGGDFTGPEAAEAIRRAEEDRNVHLVAVTAHPARLSSEARAAIKGRQNSAAAEGLSGRLLNDRFLEAGDLADHHARNVRLMPRELHDQLVAQLAPSGPVGKALQMLNRPFRMAVLPQPRWLNGNFVEPYLFRLPTVGRGIINVPGMAMDIRLANRIAKSPAATAAERRMAKEIEGQQFGGLLIGGRGANQHRTREDFKTYARVIEKFPVVEQVADLGAMATKVFTLPAEQYFKLNRSVVEGPLQRMAFGKTAREDLRELLGSFRKAVKASDEAIADLKKGLVNTPAQERYMRAQHELLGQYDGYGPFMRHFIQGPAPFLPWALSSARFVYWTMPAHRTATTALLARTAQVYQQEWDQEHKFLSPEQRKGLGADIVRKDGGLVPLERYSPYGLAGPIARGDLGGITEQTLPQLRGVINALQGRNAFGEKLRGEKTRDNPEGNVDPVGQALYSFLESSVPYLSQIRRLREGGNTAFDNSRLWDIHTKTGTSHGMSAFQRTFDPFRPVYVRPASQGGGRAVDPVDQLLQGIDPQAGSDDKAVDQILNALG